MHAHIGLKLDATYLKPDVTTEEICAWQNDVTAAHEKLLSGTGPGSDFRGWLDPAQIASRELLDKVKDVAADLRERSDALVVIGIGGSYLGARAVIEALQTDTSKDVYYAGINVSAAYHNDLLRKLEGKRVALNIISKSGTTTEPAIAFRILKKWLEEKVGSEEAARLTVATTDAMRGALLKLAKDKGYERFVVPDDVGGRYSVLTPVGLLPIAYAGIDIDQLVEGAVATQKLCGNADIHRNPAYYYAAARNSLYDKGYCVEMMSHFEPRLRFFAEWWKQLYGESEGKDGKGLYPSSIDLTADLHSMGQYAQQGRRMLLETFLMVEGSEPELLAPRDEENLDGMNYLAGRDLSAINREAYRATALAHREGRLPNMTLWMDKLDARNLGGLIYFFERACAISGYLGRVNPFDQPGVEAYKRHMFALLGKPGFERETGELAEMMENREDDIISFK